MIPWFGFVIMLGFAYFFYRAAVFESLDRPYLWGGVAALLYVVSVDYLHFGLLGALAVQVGLFVWMGVWNAMHRRRVGLVPDVTPEPNQRQNGVTRGKMADGNDASRRS